MPKPYDVMAAGHLCLDIIPRFPDTGAAKIADIMRPGKLVNVQQAAISTGGPVSNTGINMRTLGANVCFCARGRSRRKRSFSSAWTRRGPTA